MALVAAGTSPSTTIGTPIATVQIDVVRHLILVPVSIQGSRPFRLILDTGMPARGLLLDASPRVDSLGFVFQGADTIHGAGSAGAGVAIRTTTASSIALAGHSIANVPVEVLPNRDALGFAEGVIGAELFERYAVRIDAGGRLIQLFAPSAWSPPSGSSLVPIRLRDGKAFINAQVVVDSGPAISVDLAVDLGARHSLWLNQRPGRLAPPKTTITTTLGRGLSGDVKGQVGRVQRLEIGSFVFDHVVAIFPSREYQNPGGVDFRDGFVGGEILTRFVVTFDYPHERMVLEPGRRFGEPFEYDMSGMALDSRQRDRAVILAIVPGSPADEAGVRPGDVLLSIDGRAMATLGPDEVSEALTRNGAKVVLGFERDSTRVEKRLVLRRLL